MLFRYVWIMELNHFSLNHRMLWSLKQWITITFRINRWHLLSWGILQLSKSRGTQTNSVTLTFDHVTLKSIGTMYSLGACTVSSLTTFKQRGQKITGSTARATNWPTDKCNTLHAFPFLAHLSWKLKWAFLITFVHCPSVCKIFTFSSSSQEPLVQFQPNLAQSILGWRGFKFVQMKGRAFFHGEIITK